MQNWDYWDLCLVDWVATTIASTETAIVELLCFETYNLKDQATTCFSAAQLWFGYVQILKLT